MKVKIVIYSTLNEAGGGRETWIQYFMRQLLKRGYQLEIFCLEDVTCNTIDMKDEYRKVTFIKSEFLKEKKFNFLNFIKMTKKKLFLDHNNDTVYLFLGTVIEGVALLNLKKHIPNAKCYVWARSINSNEIKRRHNKLISMIPKYIETKAIQKSDHVITNGYDTFDFYEKTYNLKGKCTAIPNAVEIHDFTFPYYSLKKNPCTFIYLGRFCEVKGVYDIIAAFNSLNTETDYHCFFYGHGDNFNAHIKNSHCKIKNEVKREEIPSIYSKSNISFFLGKGSEYGGGGISHSLLEALASGHICICYDIPAYNQIIRNGYNGILIDYLDVDSVVVNIEQLLQNKNSDYYEAMQKNARLTAAAYSVDNHIEKFIALISKKQVNDDE